MTITSIALKNSVETYADMVLNGPAYNPPTVHSQFRFNHSGIVQYIKGGSFASPPPSSLHFDVTNATAKAIYSLAITDMWSQQGVFIVNASSGDAGVWNTRGLAFSSIGLPKNDITKYEFGGNTYFFMKYTKGKAPDETYDLVPGLDQIGVAGITEEDIILSSAQSQSLYGFNHTWTMDDASNAPTNGVFFNLPICPFKDLHLPDRTSPNFQFSCGDFRNIQSVDEVSRENTP